MAPRFASVPGMKLGSCQREQERDELTRLVRPILTVAVVVVDCRERDDLLPRSR